MDIIGAASDDNSIIWWGNNRGNPPYFFKHPVARIDAPYSVYLIDVDGDDGTNFLAAARDEDATVWWENHLFGVEDNAGDMVKRIVLASPHPNPFQSSTVINYQLSAPDYVELAIHDITGQLIDILASGYQGAGCYSIQ